MSLSESWRKGDIDSIKRIITRSVDRGYLPRFEKGGLSLRMELEYYIPALVERCKIMTNCDSDITGYYAMGLELYNFTKPFLYLPDEELDRNVIDNFYNPDFIDDFGNNGLIASIDALDDNLVFEDILKENIYDVNAVGAFGDRALDHAVIILDTSKIELLIEYGANPENISAFEGTVYDWLEAVANAHPGRIRDIEQIKEILFHTI